MKDPRKFFKDYGIAFIISIVTIFLKFQLEPYISPNTFLLSVASVTLSSWYGGLGPGIFATLIAAWANHTFFLNINYSPMQVSTQVNELLRLVSFVGVALLINSLNARLRTAQARAEAAADQAQAAFAEAQAANRAKDEFLAMVSHELRTPLTAIMGWIDIALLDKDNADIHRQAFEVIKRNAKSQAQLIEDLLDISRIVAGKLKLEMCAVDLPAVIRASIDTVLPVAAAKSITIDSQCRCEMGSINGDFSRLQQVVWNLLTNAIKFTPEGGRITMRLEQADQQAIIIVEDNGKGIKPDFLPYVFERFRQAENNRVYGGLGLGLAIVHHLVLMHGGTVAAASEGIGKGTVFTVSLPLIIDKPASAALLPATVVSGSHFAPVLSLANFKVLIVDDEAEARGMLSALLRKLGAEVFTAATADEALAAIERWRPDILVSDLGLKGESGYDLIRTLRARKGRQADMPAIAFTAYTGIENRLKAITAGFQDFLAKPIAPEKLAAAITQQLAKIDKG